MSLRSRLRKAAGAVKEEEEEGEDNPILPYASVHDVLAGHDLVSCFRLNPHDVHAAIVALHEILDLSEKEKVKQDSTPVQRVQPNCKECGLGYLMLDTHEALLICNKCGAVDNYRTFNIEPEFQAPPEITHKRCRKTIKGVPDWMVKQQWSQNPNRHSRFWEDLQSFNHFVSLTEDTLSQLDNVLKTWTTGGFAYEVRLVATLLYHRVRQHFTHEKTIRVCVAKSTPIPIVKQLEPEATFACSTCGTMCFTGKSARWHCRLGIR